MLDADILYKGTILRCFSYSLSFVVGPLLNASALCQPQCLLVLYLIGTGLGLGFLGLRAS